MITHVSQATYKSKEDPLECHRYRLSTTKSNPIQDFRSTLGSRISGNYTKSLIIILDKHKDLCMGKGADSGGGRTKEKRTHGVHHTVGGRGEGNPTGCHSGGKDVARTRHL